MTTSKKSNKEKTNKAPQHLYKYETKSIAIAGRQCLYDCQSIVSKISRLYKYQIGMGLVNTAAQLVYSIYDALDYVGFNEEKIRKIKICLEQLRKLIIIIRVTKDLNQITLDSFEKIVIELVSIKTQLLNWINYTKQKMEESQKETSNETTD